MKRLSLVVLALFAAPLLAGAPDTSLRPTARGDDATALAQQTALAELPPLRPIARASVAVTDPATPALLRPALRPPSQQTVTMATRGDFMSFAGPVFSPRPSARPPSIVQLAMSKRRARRKGAVCGNLDIQGEEIGRVPGKIRGCGVDDAVSIRSVSGVALNRPATMNCTTAEALNDWVNDAVKPAFKNRGRIAELRVAAHYACRTRNNQKGARISEHGKGNAIDISAFLLKNGAVVSVQDDWGKGGAGEALAYAHRKACGPFGTVLGPKADRYHQDHFHLDTARYRNGTYCR